MLQQLKDWYSENGFTLMEQQKPAIGARFQAARVVCDRGFGGVIERTRRIGVPATRRGEFDYYDELNKRQIAHSEIEAWKACL